MHKALSMLGIAAKAGRLVSGETAVEQAVRREKAALVIISEDASENTAGKFRNLCSSHQIPFIVFAPKAELGRAVGKGERSSVAVLDAALAEAVIKRI